MRLDQIVMPFGFATCLFAISMSPVSIVWLGMILISPSTLIGLTEDRIQEMMKLRRGFARLMFRSVLWLIIQLPFMGLIWLKTFAKAISPVAIGIILLLLFTIWWLYVVVGSLVYAGLALSTLKEGKAQ